jgi:ferric-dicitrate binding protein FerR (iron transport regulator)
MRELTPEQLAFFVRINSEEFREEARKNDEANRAAMAEAEAAAARLRALQRAQYEKAKMERKETMRPLMEALGAAGIQLDVHSYEGVWGSYRIGDGPRVDFDLDSLET